MDELLNIITQMIEDPEIEEPRVIAEKILIEIGAKAPELFQGYLSKRRDNIETGIIPETLSVYDSLPYSDLLNNTHRSAVIENYKFRMVNRLAEGLMAQGFIKFIEREAFNRAAIDLTAYIKAYKI